MAQRIIHQLIDDTTGETADETVTFALDGAEYEIDLATGNADRLRKEFEEYLRNARRTGGRVAAKSHPKMASGELTKIREWAQVNGHEVAERGRIAESVQEAYRLANPA